MSSAETVLEWQDHWRWCGEAPQHGGHQHHHEEPRSVGITWCPGYPPPGPGLLDFLLSRIADDEAGFLAELRRTTGETGGPWLLLPRPLAEVEAKRALVELHAPTLGPFSGRKRQFRDEITPDYFVCEECSGDDDPYIDQVEYPCQTVKVVAAIYADHPDYREEWRP